MAFSGQNVYKYKYSPTVEICNYILWDIPFPKKQLHFNILYKLLKIVWYADTGFDLNLQIDRT